MNKHMIFHITFIACLTLLSTQTFGTVVVDLAFDPFGSDTEVTVNRTADTATTDALVYDWDASTPFFNGDPAESQIIYGGYSSTGSGVVGMMASGLQDEPGSAVDYMNLENTRFAGGAMRGRALMLWDSADFLDGTASVFDTSAGSALSLTVANWNTPDPEAIRFVIRNGSGYYLSSASWVATGTFSLAGDAPGLQWAAFDPGLFADYSAGGGDIAPGGTALSYATQTFDDVTGVGFITEMERGGGGNMFFNMSDFTAELVVIPEPSTFALVCFASVALHCARRRVRRK